MNWSYGGAAQLSERFDDKDYDDGEYAGISTPNPFDFEWEMMFKLAIAPPLFQQENYDHSAIPVQGEEAGQHFDHPSQSDATEHDDSILSMPEYLS